MLAMGGGVLGFVLGAGLGRGLGESVFGTPAATHIVLLPIVMGLAGVRCSTAGQLHSSCGRAAHFNPAPVLRGE